MASLKIQVIPVTPIDQNCRVLSLEGSPDAVVIDPGGEASRIAEIIEGQGLTCREIWLTHSHFDHCGGVADLMKRYSPTLKAHKDGAIFRQNVEASLARFGLLGTDLQNCPEPSVYLTEKDNLTFGEKSFQILETPGHAPDHLCFYCEEDGVLIAGDSLFAGSIGRTDLPGGSMEQLLSSITTKLLTLPPETKVMPGHGPDTTIGMEAKANPFLT